MTQALLQLARDSERLAEDCRRFAYMSRSVELQRDAIDRLAQFCDVVSRFKGQVQDAGDEDGANLLLAMVTALRAIQAELAMFVALKEDRAADAWDHLVSAQNAAAAAVRAHSGAAGWEAYATYLYVHERNLFPPQLFLSTGMVVGHSRCSLCGEHYGECTHVAGRAYMGEFCVREILDVAKLGEISVVEHPKDKRCRIQTVSGAEGDRDVLTWRRVTGADDDEQQDGTSGPAARASAS